MKPFLLLLLMSGLGWANACVDAGNGNFNSAASWTSCGSTYPQDGDSVSIQTYTITLTSDIGTNAGGGVTSITIGSNASPANSGTLLVDGAAHHTIYLASTGSTCGTNMSGILVQQGTFSTAAATATNYITIQSPNATYPVYIAHTLGLNSGETFYLTLNYTYINNMGGGESDNGSCSGIFSAADNGGEFLTITNCLFNGGDGDVSWNSYTPGISNTTWVNRGYYGLVNFSMYGSTGFMNPIVYTNLTDYNPQTTDSFFYAQSAFGTYASFTSTGWAGFDGASFSAPLFLNTTQAPATNPVNLSYAVQEFNETQSPQGSANTFEIIAESTGSSISNSVVYNASTAIYLASSSTVTLTVNNNWLASNYNTGTYQGQIVATGGQYVFNNNIIAFDNIGSSSQSGNGIFCYNSGPGTFTAGNNTIYYPAIPSGSGVGWPIGDGGIDPCVTPLLTNNIAQNAVVGIWANGGTQTFSTAGTGGVGVSNNDIYGATTAYESTGTNNNFGTGHPNATYGDVTINPGLVASSRRIINFDSWMGGPGTDAHFFQEMAARSGLTAATGIAGGLTYNPIYTPQNLYQFLSEGFAPTNIGLNTVSSTGSYGGAVKPVIIGAWMP